MTILLPAGCARVLQKFSELTLPARAIALRDRIAGLPWWVHVVLVYAASRLFSTLVLTSVARRQVQSPWSPASPDYAQFVNFWDSGWYERIYNGGYPAELPRGDDGEVTENEWAFYPLFPATVRLFSAVTGWGWNPASILLALVYGLAAALIVYRLFRLRSHNRDALWGVALVAFFPVSPILQIPYAESLHLMLLALALYLVMTGRYLSAIPAAVLMCLARPAGVPFAAALGLLLLAGLLGQGPVREPPALIRLAVLTAACSAAAVSWPAAAWVVTGVPDAYVQTETAWRGAELTLFRPWLDASAGLLGPVLGPLVLAALVGGIAAVLLSPAGRRLGLPLQLWCAAYLLYLAAFWNPQTSTFRILLPLFPLALAAVLMSGSRAYRWLAVASFACLQVVWVAWLWAWAPLFGGGDYSP